MDLVSELKTRLERWETGRQELMLESERLETNGELRRARMHDGRVQGIEICIADISALLDSADQLVTPDPERLATQAQEISVLLSDAGIGPGSLTEGVRRLIAQRDSQKRALENIAGYSLATFTFASEEYVRASNVVHLRQIARDVVKKP